MVILATLAAIAIPSYSIYVLKSHRTEAKSALLDLASLEERYFSTANTYSSNPTDLGYNAAGTPFPVGSGWYNITTLTVTAALPPTALIPGGTPATYTDHGAPPSASRRPIPPARPSPSTRPASRPRREPIRPPASIAGKTSDRAYSTAALPRRLLDRRAYSTA
jgi:type IV pilus assembly protein PilE